MAKQIGNPEIFDMIEEYAHFNQDSGQYDRDLGYYNQDPYQGKGYGTKHGFEGANSEEALSNQRGGGNNKRKGKKEVPPPANAQVS
jgi:hypothetical protein